METIAAEDAGSTLLLIGLIFMGVGVPMFAVAVFLFFRTRRFLETAVDTTGTIIDLIASRSSEGGTVYRAVVAFKTSEGRDVQWTESMASNPPAGQPGDEVPVKYDPTNPEEARIAKPFRLWFLPGLLGLLGGLFGGLGAVFTIIGFAS